MENLVLVSRWSSVEISRVLRATVPLLLLTKDHCSSNSKAWGLTWRTRWSWNLWAWRPVAFCSRATVSLDTFTKRVVGRMPQPSPRCSTTDTTLASEILVLNSGVPRRSENSSLHAVQEPGLILTVHFVHGQVACAGSVVYLAILVDTR